MFSILYSKYRDLVIAIALFLVLDLGVLLFNFYSTREIEQDASRINIAGELRMLTQQLTKALLTMGLELRAGVPIQTSSAQLSEAHSLFNGNLQRLKSSLPMGTSLLTWGIDLNEQKEVIDKLEKEWRPLDELIPPIITTPDPLPLDVELAGTKAVARNIKMMGLTSEMANLVETESQTKAAQMRQIQLIGILLALLNFVFIVFKFVRQLRASDRATELARKETNDILDTVQEGLFLLQRNGSLGSQFSQSLDRLLGRRVEPGQNFKSLLSQIIPAQIVDAASDYIDLLFTERVKPALLKQVNPLSEIEIHHQQGATRYLDFHFSRVSGEKAVDSLLCTVFDVTEKVTLGKELANTQQRAKSDLDDLFNILEQDTASAVEFLTTAKIKLEVINKHLQNVPAEQVAYHDLMQRITKAIHGVKGEAAALNLLGLVTQAHEFESILVSMRKRTVLSGEDFIPVAVEVNKLLEYLNRLQRVVDRLHSQEGNAQGLTPFVAQLRKLTQRVANDLGKKVRFEAQVPALVDVPDPLRTILREAAPQIVRNALVHGIESPEERRSLGKNPEGLLKFELARNETGKYRLSIWDDGRGISTEDIRRRLVAIGKRSEEDSAKLSDQELVASLFDPDFTSLDEANVHGGRGVGLSVVRELAVGIGAKLRVSTIPRQQTKFVLEFS